MKTLTQLKNGVRDKVIPKPPKTRFRQAQWAERLREAEEGRAKAEAEAREAKAELARLSRITSARQFTSWIAHEINQPIAAIVTNGDAALRWLARDRANLHEANEAIQRIIRDADRALSVVNATRAMLSKDRPALQDIDVNQIIEESLLLTQAEQRRAQVRVEATLMADLPLVRGNRVQLQQVVLNLVLNGIDAMKTIEGRPRVLSISSTVDQAGEVRVQVEDSGVGIDQENVEQLFEPYFTTKVFGTGLGLPISRSIIEAHGGRLWASPANAKGAAFQFTLPAPSDEEPAQS